MSSYFANQDLDAYERRVADFDSQRQVWEATVNSIQGDYDTMLAAYEDEYAQWQIAHDEWEAAGADPATEPIEPLAPSEPSFPSSPTPPEPPATTYEAREVTEPEQIETATGPAFVVPPRFVMSASDGSSFALSESELGASYTPTTEFQARE